MSKVRTAENLYLHQQMEFEAKVWLYDGPAAWHFVTIPKQLTAPIKALSAESPKAFGSVKVTAVIGHTSWKTSLFPDSKMGAYLLPLKAPVRLKEKIKIGEIIKVLLMIES